MIYHYFGDKRGLYVAVLEHVIGELRHEELRLAIDHVDPREGSMQLFDFIHNHFGAHPELIHLLSGENLLAGALPAQLVEDADHLVAADAAHGAAAPPRRA